MATVTVKNVSKVYSGGTEAVKDFNLEIKDGEFVVIVGPSGCGKSTLLRMIAGLEDITEGEIWIGDRLMNGVAAKDRNISMVFQNYALFPHLNVFDNIAFGLKIRKTPKKEIERRVESAAELLGIGHLLRHKLGQLSGGERQRVAMGRAIVREPSVFLMDEPLSNLDAKLRTQTRAELAKLHSRLQNTFIYVTHDQTEAMTMGDRIVVMNDGAIQQAAAPKEVYERPANRFVAGFIGTPPMDFFPMEADGKHYTAGIRPEYILPCGPDAPGAKRATVELTEFLGAEKLVYLDIAGEKFIMKALAACEIGDGKEAFVCWDDGRLHLFDDRGQAVVL